MPEAWKEWEGKRAGDQFLLRRYLGGGDRSGVFLTDWSKPPRKAAIKLVVAEPDRAKTQLELWERTAELSHPRLIQFLGAGMCRLRGTDLIYLVTEYADERLSEVVPERRLSADETAELLQKVLEGLAFLHSKGWVHAELKPSNILSVDEQLKISRGGLRRMGETREDTWKPGSYDPPGVPGRRISAAGDVWSLGLTLVEALTQRLPSFDGGTREIALPEVLPPPFHQIAMQCLQPDAEDRWTIAEISKHLQHGLTVGAGASTAGAPAVSPSWWKRVMIWQGECPDCGSHDLTRSRRTSSEKTFSGVLLPYRCGRCGARFYRLRIVGG